MQTKWLIFIILVFFSGCTAITDFTTTTVDQPETTLSTDSGFFNDSVSEFKEKYELVVEKINEMVLEMGGENAGASSSSQKPPTLKLSEIDPDTIYYPEDFMDVYNNQTPVIDSELSMDFINEFQLLLEEFQSSCDFDHLILEETQSVDSDSFGSMSVMFYNGLDGHIFIHYSIHAINVDTDQFLKVGFDDAGLFHLVYFGRDMNGPQLIYNYEEFLEGDHWTLINSLSGGSLSYDFVDFSTGKQSSYSIENGEEWIMFYNLQNETQFRFNFSNGILVGQSVDFETDGFFTVGYNDDDYMPEGFVTITWQMLEATGWDYVIVQDMNLPQEGDGIFKDEQNLYVYQEDGLSIDLNPRFANVRLSKPFEKSALSDQILNLSAYGLTFSFAEISIELINQTLEDGLQMIEEKITFDNVYFRSETINQDMLTLLDPEIRYLISILSDKD